MRGRILRPFIARGEVRLFRAEIGGDLECSGATFENPGTPENPGKVAFNAEGASIKGSVHLRSEVGEGEPMSPFIARGEVRLRGAKIGGSLECDGAAFEGTNSAALNAEMVSVGGAVLLKPYVAATGRLMGPFTANGEVRLLYGKISGGLDCSGAKFKNPSGIAIQAEGVSVKGPMLIRSWAAEGVVLSPFIAKGVVRLFAAEIGSLECDGATFQNPRGEAINATLMSVKGPVSFRATGEENCHFTAEGSVLLSGAKIESELDCTGARFNGFVSFEGTSTYALRDDTGSWPTKDLLELDGFTYQRFSGDAPPTADERLEWLRRQPRFRMQPYEQVVNVLRAAGRESDARKVAMKKQVDLRRRGQLSTRARLWSLMLGFFVAHGYRPGRAALFALAVIATGAYVFHTASREGAIEPTNSDLSADALASGYPHFNPVVYSLDAFLPVIDLHQEDNWLPNNTPAKGWLGQLSYYLRIPADWFYSGYLWLHISLGWILTTFIVAALTGLIRKD